MKPIHFIFIGALITVIGSLLPSHSFFLFNTPLKVNLITISGALISGIGALMHNINSSKKSSRIEANTLAHLTEIEKLFSKTQLLSDNLIDTARKLEESITGGESYCVVTFTDNHFSLSLIGSRPMYDLEITVWDVDVIMTILDPLIKGEIDYFLNNTKVPFNDNCKQKLNYLLPGTIASFSLGNITLGTGLRNFDVKIQAKNGTTSQKHRLYKNENRWSSALRVYRMPNKELLMQHIDYDFPANIEPWD